ncbi:acyltransferase family protein [Polaromonas sp.]|uniref:acyltransferase family protein n=1 Tax=Polaromonas sp. TaxID=1869339 RepID=UPI003C9A40F1
MAGTKMKRSMEVDTLRGIACMLLVFFHTVGATPAEGLKLPEGHWLGTFNDTLAYFRMPLFSFISGYVYAFRPYQGNAPGFIKGKVRRLLLPLLTVGTFYAIVQALTPGANASVNNWWLLHIQPVGHFWFLEALFVIFLVVILLEHLKALSTTAGFALVWGVSALLFALPDFTHLFGVRGALYLMPFFLAGLACKRFEIRGSVPRFLAAAALIASLAVVLLLPQYTKEQHAVSALVSLAIGVSAGVLLLRSGWQSRPLAYIGAYSFAIYLLHVFFTAGSRIFLHKMGVNDTYALLPPGVVAGILGPIVCAQIIGRNETLNLWLLGSTSKVKTAPMTRTEAAI